MENVCVICLWEGKEKPLAQNRRLDQVIVALEVGQIHLAW